MIDKHCALKILGSALKHHASDGGHAFAFGDQLPTFGVDWARSARENLESGRRPSYRERPDSLATAREFFSVCGYSEFTDIDYNGNAKLLLDLGKPLPPELHGKAKFLYDGGVIEHIPNIHQAMKNAALLLEVGGILFEGVPVNCYGESYYNIDPLLLRDFYTANGFEMLDCYLVYNTDVWLKLIALYRRWATPGMIGFWQRKNAALRAQNQGVSWIQNKINADNPDRLVLLDPFNPSTVKRVQQRGLPLRTHVFFLGIKRRHVAASEFVAPCQEVYPSQVGQAAN